LFVCEAKVPIRVDPDLVSFLGPKNPEEAVIASGVAIPIDVLVQIGSIPRSIEPSFVEKPDAEPPVTGRDKGPSLEDDPATLSHHLFPHIHPLRHFVSVVPRIRDVQIVGDLRNGCTVQRVGSLKLGKQEVEVAVQQSDGNTATIKGRVLDNELLSIDVAECPVGMAEGVVAPARRPGDGVWTLGLGFKR
jgi:hypothetical protein